MPRGGSRPGAGRKLKPPEEHAHAIRARARAEARAARQAALPIDVTPSGPIPPIDTPAAAAAPPATQAEPVEILPLTTHTPLEYLLEVMRSPQVEQRVRLQAASLAAPYVHAKPGEAGKKDQRKELASKAGAAGKFAPSTPPKLVVSNG